MSKEKTNTENKQNYFSIFLLFFPTLIIAAIPSSIGGSLVASVVLKFLVAMYQLVVVKNFVDKYYGD